MTDMDSLLERSVGQGMTGVTLEQHMFTDIDYVDDRFLLAELMDLSVYVLKLFQEEAAPNSDGK